MVKSEEDHTNQKFTPLMSLFSPLCHCRNLSARYESLVAELREENTSLVTACTMANKELVTVMQEADVS